MHFYAWKGGLKTGMYYLRSQPPALPDRFGVMPSPLSPELLDRHTSNIAVADPEEQRVLASDDDDLPMDVPPPAEEYPHVNQLLLIPGDPAAACLGCSA